MLLERGWGGWGEAGWAAGRRMETGAGWLRAGGEQGREGAPRLAAGADARDGRCAGLDCAELCCLTLRLRAA